MNANEISKDGTTNANALSFADLLAALTEFRGNGRCVVFASEFHYKESMLQHYCRQLIRIEQSTGVLFTPESSLGEVLEFAAFAIELAEKRAVMASKSWMLIRECESLRDDLKLVNARSQRQLASDALERANSCLQQAES